MRIMYNVKDIFALPCTTAFSKEAMCITTNGVIAGNGAAVMGRGIAKEARERFPGIDTLLAKYLANFGNCVNDLGVHRDQKTWKLVHIYTLPTKHHWKDKSDLALICRSLEELVVKCNSDGITTCYLPRPGCSNGGLDWETQVKPVCEAILDDRFVIADRSLTQ